MPAGDCLREVGAEGLWFDSALRGLRAGSPRTDSGPFGRVTVNGVLHERKRAGLRRRHYARKGRGRRDDGVGMTLEN